MLGLLVYRRTNPIVARWLAGVLIGLRVVVLILLLLAAFEASLTHNYLRTEPPVVAIGVDHSASMAIKDFSGSRAELLKQLIEGPTVAELESKFQIKWFAFSSADQVKPIDSRDSLVLSGDATDLAAALQKIKSGLLEENLMGIVLLSDGNYNQGGNPARFAEQLGTPLFTVPIGASEPIPDLAIVTIEANTFAYAGERTPIKATVRNTGFPAMSLPLSLQDENRVIETKNITIAPSPSETLITFDYLPDQPESKRLTLSLGQATNEQTVANNQRTIYIDVLKSKLRIQLLAGAPAVELSFLRRALGASERYELREWVENKTGTFYQGNLARDEMDQSDLFIFQNYPTAISDLYTVRNLLASFQKETRPILLMSGKRLNSARLQEFEAFLPIRGQAQSGPENLAYVTPTPQGQIHPVLQTAIGTHVANIGSQLPPVFYNYKSVQLWPNSEVLAFGNPSTSIGSSQNWPVLISRTNGAHKSAAILAYETWRWDFLMRGINAEKNFYSQLLNNLTRWLETTRDKDLLRINLEKNQFKFGEAVPVTIQVFDEQQRPIDDAMVQITLRAQNTNRLFLANPMGSGKYQLTLNPEQAGNFEIHVDAKADKRTFGQKKALFSVGEYSAELADTRANIAVLQSLARISGGRFVPPDSLLLLPTVIPHKERSQIIVHENEIWNDKNLLFLVIMLLCIEWYLRKRKGMI